MIPGSLKEVRNRFDMTSRKRTAPRIEKKNSYVNIKFGKYTLILKILSNLFQTSFIDPGIIPRATHQEAQDIEHQMEAQNGGANGGANGLA